MGNQAKTTVIAKLARLVKTSIHGRASTSQRIFLAAFLWYKGRFCFFYSAYNLPRMGYFPPSLPQENGRSA
jgi:hypothetical protein